MKLGKNCQEYFRSLIADLSRNTKVEISSLPKSLQDCASIFDTNKKDNVLDSTELKNFLYGFYEADMLQKPKPDRELSDDEIIQAFNKFNPSFFKDVSLKDKKQLLLEIYSKVLAQQIKTQIDGPSFNQRTIARLEKINSENVLYVLKEYDRISPTKTLASAIVKEWNLSLLKRDKLDIESVKKYICKPLKKKAESVGITDIPDFEKINDINEMNTEIKALVNKINNPKTAKTTKTTKTTKTSTYKSPYNKNVSVKSQVSGISDFTYNRASLEDHVINNATDKQGRKITYFSQIPAIRAKAPQDRSKTETKLLNEFNNYMKYVCKAGEDYGVDPKQILAITQKEVTCKGLNTLADGKPNDVDVTGPNGKGYMQLTCVCVIDVMGGQGNSIKNAKFASNITSRSYNKDFEELLKSRGFNPNCSTKQKKAEAEKIWNLITANTDPEFNIRFGTLWLRYQLQKTNGNFRRAAVNYNGSSIKHQYADTVCKFYEQLKLNQKNFKA